jgi:hypothetical protein
MNIVYDMHADYEEFNRLDKIARLFQVKYTANNLGCHRAVYAPTKCAMSYPMMCAQFKFPDVPETRIAPSIVKLIDRVYRKL